MALMTLRMGHEDNIQIFQYQFSKYIEKNSAIDRISHQYCCNYYSDVTFFSLLLKENILPFRHNRFDGHSCVLPTCCRLNHPKSVLVFDYKMEVTSELVLDFENESEQGTCTSLNFSKCKCLSASEVISASLFSTYPVLTISNFNIEQSIEDEFKNLSDIHQCISSEQTQTEREHCDYKHTVINSQWNSEINEIAERKCEETDISRPDGKNENSAPTISIQSVGNDTDAEFEHLNTFEEQLKLKLSAMYKVISDEFQKELCNVVESAFRSEFPNCQAVLYGCPIMGIAVGKSSIPISLTLDTSRKMDEANESKCKKARKVKKYSKCLKSILSNRVFPVSDLSKFVPFISFKYKGNQCRLSFGNCLSEQTSKLMMYYFSLDERVLLLLKFVKYWCFKHSLVEKDSQISSFCLEWMIFSFLMSLDKPIIPTIFSLQKLCLEKLIVEGWECQFSTQLFSNTNKSSLLQLITDFFKYCFNHNFNKDIICPHIGKKVSKFSFECLNNLPVELSAYETKIKDENVNEIQLGTAMSVQDPFLLNVNIAQNVASSSVDCFRDHCKLAIEACEKALIDEELQRSVIRTLCGSACKPKVILISVKKSVSKVALDILKPTGEYQGVLCTTVKFLFVQYLIKDILEQIYKLKVIVEDCVPNQKTYHCQSFEDTDSDDLMGSNNCIIPSDSPLLDFFCQLTSDSLVVKLVFENISSEKNLFENFFQRLSSTFLNYVKDLTNDKVHSQKIFNEMALLELVKYKVKPL